MTAKSMTEGAAWHNLASCSPRLRERAEEALLAQYAPIVSHAVGRYAHRLQSTIERREDLETALRLSLLQAVRAYDPDRGAKFLTFAIFTVNHAALEFCRSATGTRRTVQTREIPASQMPWPTQDEADDSFSALLSDMGQTAPSAEDDAGQRAFHDAIAEAVSRLTPNERTALTEEPASALAAQMGLSESRVWQLRKQAQRRLRGLLAEWS